MEGNRDLSALQVLLVHTIWKLAPPIPLAYSNSMLELGGGRVRSSQEALENHILLDVATRRDGMVAEHSTIHLPLKLGSGIVDWCDLVQERVPTE
jgi:hypothetical protein